MKEHLLISIRITVVLLVITCGLYPAVVWGIGQIAFRDKANGQILTRDHKVIGSAIIAQEFTSDRFFHSRPSAAGYDGGASTGSNFGPTSQKLRDQVAANIKSYDVHENVPADAVTASGSGLDPHISPENAKAQAARVAKANGLPLQIVQQMIDDHTEGRFLGIYGEPRVNVLALNINLMTRAHPRV
jgi:potassium-transporting ATPase KdpC subunit